MNNATLLIVVIALVASIVVVLVGIGVHVEPAGSEPLLRTTIRIAMAGN